MGLRDVLPTAAIAQAPFGRLLLGQQWRYDEHGACDPGRNEPLGRLLLRVAVALTAMVVAPYVATRTVGIPLLGPAAGEVEPVDAAGLAAALLELAQGRRHGRAPGGRA